MSYVKKTSVAGDLMLVKYYHTGRYHEKNEKRKRLCQPSPESVKEANRKRAIENLMLIKSLKEDIEKYRTIAEKTTTSYSVTGGGSGKTSDKVGIYGSLIAEMSKELKVREMKLDEEKIRLIKIFSSIEDDDIKEALRLKYCELLSWDQICGRLELGIGWNALRMRCQRYLNKF